MVHTSTYQYILVHTYRNLLIACSISSVSGLDLKNSSSSSQGWESRSSFSALSTTGTYLSDCPHRGANHENLIHNDFRIYLLMKVHTSSYRYVQVCAGMNWYVLVCTSMYQYEPVCTGKYMFVLVCASMY